jgi:hypothetical protein
MLERIRVLEKTKRKGATNKGWLPNQTKTMEVRFAHNKSFNDKHGNKHGGTCGMHFMAHFMHLFQGKQGSKKTYNLLGWTFI